MNLNDLLLAKGIGPTSVLVMRHQPREPSLREAFPLIASERTDLFLTYQCVQVPKVEAAMAKLSGTGYVASFVAHGGGRALFKSLYRIASFKKLSNRAFWEIPQNRELKMLGMTGLDPKRASALWFDLQDADFHPEWNEKLIVDWPPLNRNWWRRADRNVFPIRAILEESPLAAKMKHWKELVFTWPELGILPKRWKDTLSEWRAIYYIFDISDGKGYVGSAYGAENLFGRWRNYAATGHGGNTLLRKRDPNNFRFSILERAAPDMDVDEVIRLENTWKDRLHTRDPHGLNDN